jgi:hypothetical protein
LGRHSGSGFLFFRNVNARRRLSFGLRYKFENFRISHNHCSTRSAAGQMFMPVLKHALKTLPASFDILPPLKDGHAL